MTRDGYDDSPAAIDGKVMVENYNHTDPLIRALGVIHALFEELVQKELVLGEVTTDLYKAIEELKASRASITVQK
jgi:hypothetical protein